MAVVWAFIAFALLVAGGAAFVVTSANRASKAEAKALNTDANLVVVSAHLELKKVQDEIMAEVNSDLDSIAAEFGGMLS